MKTYFRKTIITSLVTVLVACGGGGTTPTDPSSPSQPGTPSAQPGDIKMNLEQASRFLNRATFGARDTDITEVNNKTPNQWIAEQLALDFTPTRPLVEQQIQALPSGTNPSQNLFLNSFYKNSITANDQLKQRVAFALSEIFVVSFVDDNLNGNIRGVSSYYDMLGQNSTVNFRQLLENVSLHPMMGIYLSHLRNQKADSSGRKPDENYAREVMQLFTIGLYQLNNDGTIKKDANGNPIEAYTNDDVSGLARVFTGWSWAGSDTSDNRFYGGSNPAPDPDRTIKPMQMYSKFHSPEEKKFLGTTIPAGTSGTESLKIALDTLFNHPNVGPFIGKQLIQRLVTSNPSPAYVARVASVFNNNGSGVRGDMAAVVKAILTDPEALSTTSLQAPSWGKLREPVLRLTHWMRALNVKSSTGLYTVGITDDAASSLGQTPMRSGSVFNFYRPGYIPPNTVIAANGLVAPEMQITHETSVAGYLNYLLNISQNGVGTGSPRDIQINPTSQLALASNAAQLVDNLDLTLTGRTMPDSVKNRIVDAVSSVGIPDPVKNPDGTTNDAAINSAKLNRVKLATYMIMSMPEYIVQK